MRNDPAAWRWALATALFGWAVAAAAEPKAVRVRGENVNLRTAPGLESEVVAQVSRGEELEVQREEGDWLAVTPPPRVDLWVHGALVQDGAVAVPRLVVRSGPGISYSTVGRLDKGAKLDVRGAHGEWLKIAPPSGAALWINRAYVEDIVVPPPQPPPPEPLPPVRAPEPIPPAAGNVERAAVSALPAAPEALEAPPPQELVRTREQGRWVEVRGVVRRAGWIWKRPARYCIVGREVSTGAPGPIASYYLRAGESELAAYAGRNLGVYGREYWVQGSRWPVIVPERYFVLP